MSRVAGVATGLLFVGIALLPPQVQADPVVITGGALVANPPGDPGGVRIHLEGTRGFTLDAGAGFGDILFGPFDHCNACFPGETVGLDAKIRPSGTATVDGQSYRVDIGTEESGTVFLDFAGSFLVPAFSGAERVSVLAPFLFTGVLVPPQPMGFPAPSIDLLGRGIARVDLAWQIEGPGTWSFTAARYEFAPVPEPATLLLLGSGLVGVLARRRSKEIRHRDDASSVS